MSDWIPCSRKLPELGKNVLCWLYNDYYIGILTRDNHNGVYWSFDDFDLVKDDFNNVVAWMPLPAGYKANE